VHKVLFEVHSSEVGVLFALGEVLDSLFHIVTDGADSDLAVFVRCGLAVDGFHQSVGEEAVGLLAALEGILCPLGGGNHSGSASPAEVDEHVLELLVPVALSFGSLHCLHAHPSGADGSHGDFASQRRGVG